MRKLNLTTCGGMSRQNKTVPHVKKVMPPAIPDMYGKISGQSSVSGGTGEQQQTVILSVDDDNIFISSAETSASLMMRYDQADYGDDQGIDLTQSPGRDSPISLSGSAGSGSRHSTVSLDSGRASSYLTGASNSSNRSVSVVGSCGVLSSPRCSVSSCSIGSGNRMSNHSNRSDHDIISEWLMEIHFHEYTFLFLEAGYDLPTITRMTPEDLTAIGIKKPNHRERLKRHIDVLKLPDMLPNYVPESIDEWLRILRLEEYVQPLLAQGYKTVNDVTQLTWEDLEDIGIVKLGHQKKILLAIKRVKDIICGKVGSVYSAATGLVSLSQATTSSLFCQPTTVRSQFDEMIQQQQFNQLTYSTFTRQPITGSSESYYSPQQQQQTVKYSNVQFNGAQAIYRRNSYDDIDITPTNEVSSLINNKNQVTYNAHQQQYLQGGGTLPRQHQRSSYGVRLTMCENPSSIAQRQRPTAKIVTNNLKIAPPTDGIKLSSMYSNQVLGQIENVEMATAALDAMHFSNFLPFSNHVLNSNASSNNNQLIQPIYHNQIIFLQQQHEEQKQKQDHDQQQVTPVPVEENKQQQHEQTQQHLNPSLQRNYTPQPGQQMLQHQQQYHSLQQQPHHNYSNNYAGQTRQTTVEVHKTQNDNKSNSSLESIDQIPFANENAGTIKQRSLHRNDHHPLLLSHSSSSTSSSSSSTGSITTTLTSYIQQLSPPNQTQLNSGAGDSVKVLSVSSILERKPSVSVPCSINTSPSSTQMSIVGTNVLNDIGNMLANLTDELDAMLEEENRAGISDME